MNRYALTLSLLSLLGLHQAAQADELGRLFYTPQQRQQLEYQQGPSGGQNDAPRNYIIVNGVVQKKGGHRTVWINGMPQPSERSNNKNPSVEPVTVPGKSRPVQLKVGQPLLLNAPAEQDDNQ